MAFLRISVWYRVRKSYKRINKEGNSIWAYINVLFITPGQCLGGQTYDQPKMNKHLKFLKCLPYTYRAGALLLSQYTDWSYCSRLLQKQSKCHHDFILHIEYNSNLYYVALGVYSSSLVLPYYIYSSLKRWDFTAYLSCIVNDWRISGSFIKEKISYFLCCLVRKIFVSSVVLRVSASYTEKVSIMNTNHINMVFVQTDCQFCSVLSHNVICRQILARSHNTRFHENLSGRRRFVSSRQTVCRMDRHDELFSVFCLQNAFVKTVFGRQY